MSEQNINAVSGRNLRIAVHDYPGHAFPVQLSRALAGMGHQVLHVCFPGFQGPKGELDRRDDDPDGLQIVHIDLGEAYQRYNFLKRRRQEIRVGRLIAGEIDRFVPEIILSGNAPVDAQEQVWKLARRRNTPFVFWVQDLVSKAIRDILSERWGLLGHAIGAFYQWKERRMLQGSVHSVVITEDFIPALGAWGVPPEKITVVENWAPIDDLPLVERDNAWAKEQGLGAGPRLIYSGTLSLKHDPSLLLKLAENLEGRDDGTELIVVSEGAGSDFLREKGEHLKSLSLLPFQPFDRFPEVLGSADILVVVLEPDAGVFSVPSKILSYFCAGRPVLASMPEENLAARLLVKHGCGRLAGTGQPDAFVSQGDALLNNREERAQMGKASRAYAEATFDIRKISGRFDVLFRNLVG